MQIMLMQMLLQQKRSGCWDKEKLGKVWRSLGDKWLITNDKRGDGDIERTVHATFARRTFSFWKQHPETIAEKHLSQTSFCQMNH